MADELVRDGFGRILAYIEVDGIDIGERLLLLGLADEYPAEHPRREKYKAVIEQSKKSGRGVWR